MLKLYKNQTTYNRAEHNKENPYMCLSSAIYRDSRLGSEEIAIMVALLSNSNNFIINKKEIGNRLKIGADRLNKAWKNLNLFGYIEKKSIQGGIHWTINESPIETPIVLNNKIIYGLKLQEDDGTTFYKIGVTEKSIKTRFGSSSSMPYSDYTILFEKKFEKNLAIYIEQKIHSELYFSNLKYMPIKNFAGKTECYTDINKIKQLIQIYE